MSRQRARTGALWLQENSPPNSFGVSECFCLVDKNSIGSYESFENIAYGECNAPFSYGDAPVSVGTGEIASIDYNPRQECWKVSSKSSKAKLSKSSSSPSSKGSKSSSTPQRY